MSSQNRADERIPIAAPDVSERAMGRVMRVLESGDLADGEEVRQFEDAFAKSVGVEHAVATANGTAALHAALVACGIGEGDTVVTTPLSFVATANAVRFCGARPVFADVEPGTLNLSPDAVERTVAERDGDVDAILPVHLYGLPADLDRLRAVADRCDAVLLEDAAQAHGARDRGRPVGSVGTAGAFSFYPTKNMTTGEGGMVVTDRDDVADRARRFVNHGRDEQNRHVSLGHNFRMTSVAAAIGRVQLDRLPAFVRRRRENAARLTAALAETGTGVAPPPDPDGVDHAYHQYTVRTADREALVARLDEHGVDSAVYYPRPIHEEPAYEAWDVTAPVAERATDAVLSVPVHPGLSDGDVARVAEALRTFDPESAASEREARGERA